MNVKYLEKIREAGLKEVESGWIAGGAAAVVKDGKTVYSCGFGKADIANNIDMDEKTIVRLFSLSKPVTACAVLRLVEQGKLDLYSSVWWYLNGFKDAQVWDGEKLVPANREIRIKDLLHMTSGILYPGGGFAGEKVGELMGTNIKNPADGVLLSTVDFANAVGKCPLGFQPGEIWNYGLSADILGAIVEVVSGMSYGEFLKKEIFEPMGMEDTGFSIPEDKLSRCAKIYDDKGNGLEEFNDCFLGLADPMKCRKPMFESGGAGLTSTITDYSKIAYALANGGMSAEGYRLLSKKSVEYMRTPALTEPQKKGYNGWESMYGHSYGCLVRVLDDPANAMHLCSKGEFGWDGWAGTYFCADPENNMATLLFLQRCNAGTNRFTRLVRNIVFGAME